jgi:AcrR family transcriptional regulator
MEPMDDDRKDPDKSPAAGLGIPRSLELLWGLGGRTPKGPRPALSIGRIIEAATEVADAEGVGALSMARIASQVGFTTMSLYRYVAGKDELLMLMADAATGLPPDIADLGKDWRADLETWAWGLLDAYRRHPWVVQIPISGPPLGPNALALMDFCLQALSGTGLTEQEKASTVLLLAGFVRNEASLLRDLVQAEQAQLKATGGTPVAYGRQLDALIDERSHPALHRAVVSGIFDDEDGYGDADFAFGLARVLDGIEALVKSRRSRRSRR